MTFNKSDSRRTASRVSIKDVAEKAGVSTATVSHVINGTRFVREETRQRVLTAIEQLNYQPNALARGLVTNKTEIIGLVISDITNPFFTAVARGVEDTLTRQGYQTIFCNTDEDPDQEAEALRLLAERQIDGLILAPTGASLRQLERLITTGIPIVQIDRQLPGLDAPIVGVDNKAGAYQAVHHLTELGHRRIAVLTGVDTISTQQGRIEGYRHALQDAEIPPDERFIIQTDPRSYKNRPYLFDAPASALIDNQLAPSAYQALQVLLNLAERPTAIFVTNNQMTLGAISTLRDCRLRCPDDVSLISFDDHEWASLFSPPITVVRQPTYQIGQTAAEVLINQINGLPVTSPTILPVELIKRGSCCSPRVKIIP